MERRWWTLIAVCAATFMLLLDVSIVVVALPTVQSDLHTSFIDIQWVVDAYALTLAAALLTSGSLADRYGRRRLFTAGLVIFTAASAMCGAAQDSAMLIVSRAVQGIGGSILFATSLALLAQAFRGAERGVAFGVWGAITGAATGLGPLLGGVLTSGVSWRTIFWVNLPIGLAALAITRWKVSESREPDAGPPDWAGFATLTAGLVSLVYGLIRAGQHSWSERGVISCLCLAAALIAAFLVIEARAPQPLLDLRLFRVPTFTGGLIAAFAMNGSLFAMFLYLVIYLQDVLGCSALGTGMRLLLVSGVSLVVSAAAGRMSQSLPARWLIGPGLLLVGAGLLLMCGLDAHSDWTHLIPGFILAGIGSGLVNPPLASTAVGVVPSARAGMASGANSTLRQIGVAVGIAVYGTTFTNRLHAGLTDHLAASPGLSHRTSAITAAVTQGQTDRLLDTVPAAARGELAQAIRTAFTSGLNDLLFLSGALALTGGVLGLLLIRSKDFHRA
ncbi:MFS transporter [Streptomyces ardesiacus]